MVDLLTTNHTSFNREYAHFLDLTTRVLPEIRSMRQSPRRLRIWSAACSSGEEPYSIAIALLESIAMERQAWDALILATDIAGSVITRARSGRFNTETVAGLEPDLRRRYFVDEPDGNLRISRHCRDLVRFAVLNLQGIWPMRGPFDVIFCRNVLIYFDADTKRRLVQRLHDLLAPGGTLYVGHTESLGTMPHEFDALKPSVYTRRNMA
ncbi:MAG: CheR family methyltransferase [Planctomycetota bacterium]